MNTDKRWLTKRVAHSGRSIDLYAYRAEYNRIASCNFRQSEISVSFNFLTIAARLLDDVVFIPGEQGQEFSMFTVRHAVAFERRTCVFQVGLPLTFGDGETRVGCFHISSDIETGTA